MGFIDILIDAFSNSINITFFIIIIVLGFFDLRNKKDLKSQIVSVGVLGTFVGIYIGLQDFNPEDMKHSINQVLIGLKTAFFTSIIGMVVAIFLSVYQRLIRGVDDEERERELLSEIVERLKVLESLDKHQVETKDELKTTLNENFLTLNSSLENRVENLGQDVTKDIVKTLENVIEEVTKKLQLQFGENFVKLNDSLSSLLKWQENYKEHLEEFEKRVEFFDSSMQNSKESLEIIASKNEEIFKVYNSLEDIIKTYNSQTKELTSHLETYASLGNQSKEMFSTITLTIQKSKEEFSSLFKDISSYQERQKEYLLNNSKEIKESQIKLNEEIKEHYKSGQEESLKTTQYIKEALEMVDLSIEKSSENYKENVNKTQENIVNSYKELNETVTNSLNKSIEVFEEKIIDLSQNINENIASQQEKLLKTTESISNLQDKITTQVELKQEKQQEETLLTVEKLKEHFIELLEKFENKNSEGVVHFSDTTEEIKRTYINLSQHLKNENYKQKEALEEIAISLKESLKDRVEEVSKVFENLSKEIALNQENIKEVSTNFNELGEVIPKALNSSIGNLDKALASITLKFQDDYEKVLNKYKEKYEEK